MNYALALFTALIFMLTGCSTPLNEYRQQQPKLVLEDYFNGQVVAWGIVEDYQNKVTRRFCVAIDGQWQTEQQPTSGVLFEQFWFDDGETSTRTWQIDKLANNTYQGRANDVTGIAKGVGMGNTFVWQYYLDIPLKNGSTINVYVDDWIYQIDEYRAFNRSDVRKFGITVAEFTLFFEKLNPLSGSRTATDSCESFKSLHTHS